MKNEKTSLFMSCQNMKNYSLFLMKSDTWCPTVLGIPLFGWEIYLFSKRARSARPPDYSLDDSQPCLMSDFTDFETFLDL